jgi:hypothetical protein
MRHLQPPATRDGSLVWGLIFLALGMIGEIFLITAVLLGGVVASVATVRTGAAFAWVWYAQPLLLLRD